MRKMTAIAPQANPVDELAAPPDSITIDPRLLGMTDEDHDLDLINDPIDPLELLQWEAEDELHLTRSRFLKGMRTTGL